MDGRQPTGVVAERVPLAPDDCVSALDVHRFEGVLRGLWSVDDGPRGFTFIGVPRRRAYFEEMDCVVIPVRVLLGRRDLVVEVEMMPHSARATEVRMVAPATATRRTARAFERHALDLRLLLRAFSAALVDAASRIGRHEDLFDTSFLAA
jgi:hypothetical protein